MGRKKKVLIGENCRRNVVLFEPTQNLQTTSLVYVQNDEYEGGEPMRVFYSHKDKHFDVIYTMENVERLAESQGELQKLKNSLKFSVIFRPQPSSTRFSTAVFTASPTFPTLSSECCTTRTSK